MRKLTSGMLNEFLKNNSAISSKNLLLGLEIARQWRYVEGDQVQLIKQNAFKMLTSLWNSTEESQNGMLQGQLNQVMKVRGENKQLNRCWLRLNKI